MKIPIAGKTAKAVAVAILLAAIGGMTQASASNAALLSVEDDWRRIATDTVRDEAAAHAIPVAKDDSAFAIVPDGGGTIGSVPASGSHVLYLSRPAHRLKAGLYQATIDSTGRAKLYYFDPLLGRITASLRVPPGDPAAFHTGLGDDMCRNAPGLIMEYCQTFVACAAYGFLC